MLAAGAAQEDPWIGFEQEYTLLKSEKPLGFPEDGYPAPQGPYYCGVGGDVVFGRPVVEAHTRACIAAGIMIYGINAEVLPGQWEFQIGYRGITGESADPLTVSDHLCLARYLLLRIAEGFGVVPTFAAKPVTGDWNGAGMHTNFSTLRMRQTAGLHEIHRAITSLGAKHDEHIAVYGDGLAERLTGLHETCSMHEFRAGVADRGASVRIPLHVAAQGVATWKTAVLQRTPIRTWCRCGCSKRCAAPQPRLQAMAWPAPAALQLNPGTTVRRGVAKRLLEDRCAFALAAACNWRG